MNVPGRWDIHLRTFSLLKGLPVIEINSGSKIGNVNDISISDNGMVKGLLIRKGALFKKTFLISVKDVSAFGWDGVMIEDQSVLKQIERSRADDFTVVSENRLAGRMLMTQEGQRLGLLEDVYFQEEMGTIVGYELSDGFFSDMLEGKRVVKADIPPAIGKDAIIVNVKE